MDDSSFERNPDFSWEESEDLTVLSLEELNARLHGLVEEEKKVSYRRRVLQGRIDVIRAEVVRRGEVALSPEDLARVLLGDEVSEEEGREG